MGYLKHTIAPSNSLKNPGGVDGGFPQDPSNYWNLGTGWSYNPITKKVEFDGSSLVEYITNGAFASGASWTAGARWGISGGQANRSGAGSPYDAANTLSQDVGAIAGQYYMVSVRVSAFTTTGGFAVDIGNSAAVFDSTKSYFVSVAGVFLYCMVLKCGDDDGILRIKSAGNGTYSIDDISVVDASQFSQEITFASSGLHSITIDADITAGTTGHVMNVFIDENGQIWQGFPDGGFSNQVSGSSGIFAVVPTKDFNGTVDGAGFSAAFVSSVQASLASSLDDAKTYRLRIRLGGSLGSVTVDLDSEGTFEYQAGSNLNTEVVTGATGANIIIAPSADFNGTIDDISVRESLGEGRYGEELVPNGFFTGSADGWTLSDGWAYQGEAGGALPTYRPSIATVLTRIDQDLATPQFVVGGAGGEDNAEFKLFKKSNVYGFHVFRTEMFQVGSPFDVMKIGFPVFPGISGEQIVQAVIRFDDETDASASNLIDEDHYPDQPSYILLGPKNFRNKIRGQKNFFIEFQITGTDLCVIGVPIDIEIDDLL